MSPPHVILPKNGTAHDATRPPAACKSSPEGGHGGHGRGYLTHTFVGEGSR
ncbi:hypothetical protein MCOR19_006974, partial [Pyricularia oryzae]